MLSGEESKIMFDFHPLRRAIMHWDEGGIHADTLSKEVAVRGGMGGVSGQSVK